MNEYVNRLHRAARTSDYNEMRKIVAELVTVGMMDSAKADQIMREVDQPSTLF